MYNIFATKGHGQLVPANRQHERHRIGRSAATFGLQLAHAISAGITGVQQQPHLALQQGFTDPLATPDKVA